MVSLQRSCKCRSQSRSFTEMTHKLSHTFLHTPVQRRNRNINYDEWIKKKKIKRKTQLKHAKLVIRHTVLIRLPGTSMRQNIL